MQNYQAQKANAEANGVEPVTLALAGVLGISAWCSYRVWWAAEAVKEAANDKDTYLIFITEGKMISDNEKVEQKLNASQAALLNAQAEAVMLLVACGLLGLALVGRVLKQKGFRIN